MHITSLRILYQILEFQLEWLVSSLPSVRANGLQALIFFFFLLFLLIRRLLYIQISAQHGEKERQNSSHPSNSSWWKIHPGNPSLFPLSLSSKEGSFCLFEEINPQDYKLTLFFQPSSSSKHFKDYHSMEEKVAWEKGVVHGKRKRSSFKTQSGTDFLGIHGYPTHL